MAGHAAPAGRPPGAVRATILSVGQPWIDPTVTGVGRVPMHSVPHPDRLDLDGTWRFQLLRRPDAATAADGWRDIEVPGCWTRQDTFDLPHYTNVQMPFPGQPPDEIPELNPTGVYERTVEIPAAWAGRRIVLHVGAAESVLIVTLDGVEVGIGKDSHLASEFDLTDRLAPGSHTLTLRVVKWSDATFVEDQDQWWHGGITRSVFLYATGRPYLADIKADRRPRRGPGDRHARAVGRRRLRRDRRSSPAGRSRRGSAAWATRSAARRRRSPARRHPLDPTSRSLMRRMAVDGGRGFDAADRAAWTAARPARSSRRGRASSTSGPSSPASRRGPRRRRPSTRSTVALRSPGGDVVETAELRIGFRRVEIRGVDLLDQRQARLPARHQPPRLRPGTRAGSSRSSRCAPTWS